MPMGAAALVGQLLEDDLGVAPPDDLCCPITRELFHDPVLASDGETYERKAIETWIAERRAGVEVAQAELALTGGESERAAKIVEAGIKSPLGIGNITAALLENRAIKRRADQWRAASFAQQVALAGADYDYAGGAAAGRRFADG